MESDIFFYQGVTYNHLYYHTCSCAAVWWHSDCWTRPRVSGTERNLSSCAPRGTLLQTAEPFHSRHSWNTHARVEQDYVFKLKSVCVAELHILVPYPYPCASVSLLTHAVIQRKRGSENRSELLGVSSQNNLTRLCLEQPFVQQITKVSQHIQQIQYNYRKHTAVCFLLPANGTKHSVSTACPASSTNTCVKWPAGMFPVTSLQRSERKYMVAMKMSTVELTVGILDGREYKQDVNDVLSDNEMQLFLMVSCWWQTELPSRG